MKGFRLASLIAVSLIIVAAAGAADIRGAYVEARNAEVYTSHCYANSELGLVGDLAVMTWRIDEGSWNDVSLNGLGVAAAVRASSTLGDPFHNPYPAKAVLIFDEKATAEQRVALESFVKAMGGELLETVVNRTSAPISMSFDGDMHGRLATVQVGDLMTIRTRPIDDSDSLCHLDDLYFSPLVSLDHAMAAFGEQMRFAGEGLDVRFDQRNRSNVFIGTFHFNGAVSD
ncbi:MAG TPA: DUF1326 domain-containing protein [Bryobacterales bacterium]|nr:DUF1326 domain-containing protein [Bryobacterales bacterium]